MIAQNFFPLPSSHSLNKFLLFKIRGEKGRKTGSVLEEKEKEHIGIFKEQLI